MDLSLKDAYSSNTLHKFFWLVHTCSLIGSFINDGRNRSTVHNMNGYAHQPSHCVFWKQSELEEAGAEDEPTVREYGQAAKVFLQRTPEYADMWDAANDLIPR